MSCPVVLVGEGNGLYRLGHKIGSGGQGCVFVGIKDDKPEELFAIKISTTSELHSEADVYKIIQGGVGIPTVKWFGHVKVEDTEMSAMVMDKLGHSLEALRKRCGKKFSLKTVLMLADKMIDRVEYLHSKGFLHRDIKPDNFVMGTGLTENMLHLIDFGLAKKYIDTATKIHIPMSRNNDFVGTPYFASRNAHLGLEQGRCDDLESLAYTLVYLRRGSFPWKGVKAVNLKQKVEKITELKLSTTVLVLCKDLPQEFTLFFHYCRGLAFAQNPDYMYVKMLFNELFKNRGFVYDHHYDWTEKDGVDKSNNT